ncbi:hypothetical protein [Brumimicrobium mesophilum]|uniref:hypothetical protein n=1 Tax=Brumimicrobium mesophilum TaxID=392717 RepID=UPI000D13EE9C|nr:hypothetical protein [Brumimicrobium mesophilum]
MSEYAKIKELIRAIVGDMSNLPIFGTVTSVDSETCTIKLSSGLKIPDVRLRATVDGSTDFLKLIPKIGSKALVLSITGELDDLVMIKCDETEKIEYSQDGLIISIDSTDKKISIKNDTTSLHDIFDKLSALITNLKVNTPAGPSVGLLPDTIAELEVFETTYNSLLK